MIQCTAHPAKGDLLAFEGLSMEEEEKLERFAVVQLNQLLHSRKRMSRYFSKEFIKLADPYYGSSDEESPKPPRRKQTKKRTSLAARPSACSAEESESDESSSEEGLSSMAALFQPPPED